MAWTNSEKFQKKVDVFYVRCLTNSAGLTHGKFGTVPMALEKVGAGFSHSLLSDETCYI